MPSPAPTVVDVGEGIEITSFVREASSEAEASCRICFEPCTSTEAVPLACDCKNVVIHEECAKRWFTSRGSDVCEICLKPTLVPITVSPWAATVTIGADGAIVRRRGWLANSLFCCCFADADDRENASLFDIFLCFLAMSGIMFLAFLTIYGFDALRSMCMAYALGVTVVLGSAQFLVVLRRLHHRRPEQLECCWAFVAMCLITNQLAYALALSRVYTPQQRDAMAQGLTFALSVSTLIVPQAFMVLSYAIFWCSRTVDEFRYH